jgi:hypothetical protein
MDPTEIDTKEIDALVKECQKNMEKAGCKDILSLKEEIGKLKLSSAEKNYFVQKYSGLFSSKPEAPAAAAPGNRYLSLLGPKLPGVPTKVTTKGGKSRRRRNKKGKKKTNKRRRN